MDKEELSFGEAKEKVGEHLKTLNIEKYSITFAKLEKDVWIVNIEYKEKSNGIEFTRIALFIIDVKTGNVKQFLKDYAWSF